MSVLAALKYANDGYGYSNRFPCMIGPWLVTKNFVAKVEPPASLDLIEPLDRTTLTVQVWKLIDLNKKRSYILDRSKLVKKEGKPAEVILPASVTATAKNVLLNGKRFSIADPIYGMLTRDLRADELRWTRDLKGQPIVLARKGKELVAIVAVRKVDA